MNTGDLPPEILDLPVAERLELVCKIWDSIALEGTLTLSQQQRDLVDERIAEADEAPELRVLASEVFEDARRRS